MKRWLLLHGVPTGGRYWSRLDLPGEVVAPNLPGLGPELAGYAEGGPGPLRMEEYVALVRPQAGEDVTVVGVDFGGVVAAQLAAEGGAGRLVLMSTALGAAWLPSRWASYPPLSTPLYRWSAGQRFLGAADPSGELARAFPSDPGLADRMIGVARSLDIAEMRRARARVAARGVPTLCLWGASDAFFPPILGKRLAHQLNADWRTIPGRHAVGWTHPAQVSAALRAW